MGPPGSGVPGSHVFRGLEGAYVNLYNISVKVRKWDARSVSGAKQVALCHATPALSSRS